ncbi:Putative lipoprotein [Klebsiella aerogenes]|nr:Putative lipoprotein [Klebsiella aerogenes]
MKKLFFAGMVVALAGCVQVDRYEDVVKAPAPAGPCRFLANERAAERDDES